MLVFLVVGRGIQGSTRLPAAVALRTEVVRSDLKEEEDRRECIVQTVVQFVSNYKTHVS